MVQSTTSLQTSPHFIQTILNLLIYLHFKKSAKILKEEAIFKKLFLSFSVFIWLCWSSVVACGIFSCSIWGLVPNWDGTQVPCTGSTESSSLDCQESPTKLVNDLSKTFESETGHYNSLSLNFLICLRGRLIIMLSG